MKIQDMSNVDFVHHLMSFSNYGALSQVFVIEAIRYYAEAVAKQKKPEKEDPESIISPIAWHGVAVEILERMENKYDQGSNT